jgi:hypothetical protein
MNKRQFLRQLELALGEADVIDAAAIAKIDALLWVLYPSGLKPNQYADVVRAVRVLDRLCAAAEPSDANDGRALAHANTVSLSQQSGLANNTAGGLEHETLAEEAVVQAVEDDATAPILKSALAPAPKGASTRPWTPLGEFSLSKTSPERRLVVSHYAAQLDHPIASDDDAIVIMANPPSQASNG